MSDQMKRPGRMAGTPETIRIGGVARNVAIDSLRGIAIILMVMGHVIGNVPEAGMQVSDTSGWRYFYLLLEDVRMPLFTALSGLVYGMRPISSTAGYGRLVKGKVWRLLIPLITVGLSYHVIHTVTPGTNFDSSLGDAWRVLVYGGGYHFWFLQAVFVIFLLVGLADGCGLFRVRGNLLIAIVTTSVISLFFQVPEIWDIFSINNAMHLLPFFLLGCLAARGDRNDVVLERKVGVLLGVVAFSLFTVRALEIFGVIWLFGYVSRVASLGLAMTAIYLLIAYRHALRLSILARLGYFSFVIYLMHVFGTAPTRLFFGRVGIENDSVTFVACLVAGLVLPILFEITFGRMGWVSWTFLGQRPYRARRNDGSSRTRV